MSVTIQEVAEAAGVSKATVSKVLHKSYSISQETCDRVNAVIKELGYQPNRRAQSFATGATKTILFLAEMQHGVGFDNPHLFEIMAGVENALSEKGYGLIVQHSTALDLWQHFDELLQGSYVDGVICCVKGRGPLSGAYGTALHCCRCAGFLQPALLDRYQQLGGRANCSYTSVAQRIRQDRIHRWPQRRYNFCAPFERRTCNSERENPDRIFEGRAAHQ